MASTTFTVLISRLLVRPLFTTRHNCRLRDSRAQMRCLKSQWPAGTRNGKGSRPFGRGENEILSVADVAQHASQPQAQLFDGSQYGVVARFARGPTGALSSPVLRRRDHSGTG